MLENLYMELWRRQLRLLRSSRIAGIEKAMAQEKPTLEQLLAAFADAFFEPFADPRRSHHLVRLMAREIIDPHLPADMFLTEMVKPVMEALEKALIKTCPGLEKSTIPLSVGCFIGQLLHLLHMQTVFEQGNEQGWFKFELSDAVNHIVKFSAAGIRAFVDKKTL